MSLDKLKTSWDSLNDSVDQKEIVTIKKMRKELYDSKYDRLIRGQRQFLSICGLIILLSAMLMMIIEQEMNVLSFFNLFAGLFAITIALWFPDIELKHLKMDDNIQSLKKKIQKYEKKSKIVLIIGIIVFPIFLAVILELTKTNNPRVILIAFALGTSCLNALLFYMSYSTNKIFNSMLEDIKQLEELDMY